MVNQYCAHSFARNWQLPFLNERKVENDRRKYFMINLHERMLPTSAGFEPVTSWSPRTALPTEPPRSAASVVAKVLGVNFTFLFIISYPYLLAEKFSCSAMFSKKEFGIVSNLRFISMTNFMLSWVEHEKSFITSWPDWKSRSTKLHIFIRLHISR